MKNILGINNDIEKENTRKFLEDYQKLCEKYNRAFVPQINLGLTKVKDDNPNPIIPIISQ